MTPLRTPDAYADVVRASYERPVLVFKHSASCPISSIAHAQVERLGTEPDDPEVFRVVVQKDRPLSNQIEADTGVRHESPQALLFWQGEVVWHASHLRISSGGVRDAIRRAV